MSTEYNALLAKLTERGKADKAADRPLLTDGRIWDIATALAADARLPHHELTDALPDLRDAYEEGFKPDLFNVSRIAAEVARLGINAELVDTSGGCITLYCGERIDDAHYCEPRWAVSAGQGYRGEGGDVFGHHTEFGYGPHDYSSDGVTPEPGTPAVVIARHIAQIVELVNARRAQLADARLRVAQVADDAEQAMWAVVAEKLPECTSGDFPPDAVLSEAIHGAVRYWLDLNFGSTIHGLPPVTPTDN